MIVRAVAAMVGSAALAAVLTACGDSGRSGTGSRAEAPVSTTAYEAPRKRPRGVVENCSTRSEAGFPDAFSNPSNVVVGPLVFVGAAYTPPETVREFGGNKFPVLVRAGHRVTVALSRRTRAVAGLGYGPLPEGVELKPRDGHRVVTFKACRRGEESGSTAGALPVTFWSGFVLTKSPRCVPLEVWVDDERTPRRTTLKMGVSRCDAVGPGERCPVTQPSRALDRDGFNYGNKALRVALWPRGVLRAGVLPDGSSWAEIRPDGTIVAKLGWHRDVEGQLRIEGRRLDGRAPPLRADVPAGYGPSGFQPTGLSFPTTGCWQVTGSLADSTLKFVVLVRKR